MSELNQLLEKAHEQGITLWSDEGKLCYRAPEGTLTAEFKAQLKAQKSALLLYLNNQNHRQRPERPPLSYGQERIWYMQKLNPTRTDYAVESAFHITGEIDIVLMNETIVRLVRRHKQLRCCFPENDHRPWQRINKVPESVLRVENPMEASSRKAVLRKAKAFIHTELQRPFSLQEGPLFKAFYLPLHYAGQASKEGVLLFTMHHIIMDGWSADLFYHEFSELYSALVEGGNITLKERTHDYIDYAVEQRLQANTPDFLEKRRFWPEYLQDVPLRLDLPTDGHSPEQNQFDSARHCFSVDEGTSQEIRSLCTQMEITPFQLFLVVFGLLLKRISSRQDLLVGVPVSGRDAPEYENLFGLFLSTVPVHLQYPSSSSFRSVLSRNRRLILDALDHKQIPFEQIVEDLNPPREPGINPLFQVFFNQLPHSSRTFVLPGVEVEPLDVEMQKTRFALTAYLIDQDGRFDFEFEYARKLFSSERIEAYGKIFLDIIDALITEPDQSIDQIKPSPKRFGFLPDPHLLLNKNKGVKRLHCFLEQTAVDHPDLPLLSKGQQSYRAEYVNKQSNRLAHILLESPRTGHQVIPVIATRNPELFAAVHGILKSGASFMLLDPQYPAAHHQRALSEINPPQIWAVPDDNGTYSDLANALESDYPVKRLPQLDQFEREFSGYSSENPNIKVDPDQGAYIGQTSGTTGIPQLIRGSHRSVSHFLEWYPEFMEFQSTDRFALTSGLSHDPLLRELFLPAATGCPLFFPPDSLYENAKTFPDWLHQQQITVLHTIPSVCRLLIEAEHTSYQHLRHIILGGEKATFPFIKKLQEKAPQAMLWNAYGATETPQIKAMCRVDNASISKDSAMMTNGSLPVGKGVPDTQLLILNDQNQQTFPYEPGICYVRSPYLADGYLCGANHKAFVQNPCTKTGNDLLFNTGDRAYYNNDGEVIINGRMDHQLNISGHRVEPDEIAGRLEALKEIEKAFVTVLSGGSKSTDASLQAFVVWADDAERNIRSARLLEAAKAQSLQIQLRRELPAFMIPARIYEVGQLPLSPNGKVNALKLLQWAEQNQHNPKSNDTDLANPWEQLVADTWEEYLDTKVQNREANFFELGGHSLLGLRMFGDIEKKTGIGLPLNILFERPTIRGIADMLHSAQPQLQSLQNKYQGRPFPLSDAQQRIWILSEVQGFAASYAMPSVVHLHGRLDVHAFEEALKQLIREEPALRTCFGISGGVPWQQIGSDIDFSLQRMDVRGDSDPFIREQALQNLELEGGYPYQFKLLKVDAAHHIFVAVFHHIITDAWSNDLMVQKLKHYYHLFKKGTACPDFNFEERTDQYYNHIIRQNTYPETPAGQRDLSYWKNKMAHASSLDLTPDYRRPSRASHRGARLYLDLDQTSTRKLEEWCRAQGASLYAGLLTLVSLLLHKYTHQEDFTIGTVVSGRQSARNNDFIGCFVNMIPLRVKTNRSETLTDFLAQMHGLLGEALEHQYYPFDRLIRELGQNRSLARHPLFNVAVVYQNALDTDFSLDELETEHQSVDTATTKFDLTFTFEKRDETLRGYIEYAEDLFDARRIEYMLKHVQRLIQQLDMLQSQKLARIKVSAEEEVLQLRQWNDSSTNFPDRETLTSLFLKACQKYPDRTALIWQDHEITYRHLYELSRRAAVRLKNDFNIQCGQRVLVSMDRSYRTIPVFLAVNWVGAAYIPVDPLSPEQRRRHIEEDSNPALIIDEDRASELLKKGGEGEPEPAAQPTDSCYVIYTSGSTGVPKGCEVLHRNIVNLLFNQENPFTFSEQDTWISCHSFSFDFSVWEMYGALLRGGTLVIADEKEYRNPQKLIELIRDRQVTVLNQTPPSFYNLMEAEKQCSSHNLDEHLRYVIFGGDRLEPGYLKPWTTCYAPEKVQLINMYGITETTVHVTFAAISQTDIASSLPGSPIGRPLPGVAVEVLDDDGNPCPIGVPGEFVVSGLGVSNGYLNQPDLNEEKFIRLPQQDFASYRTGDVGRWRFDGTLEYFDRNDRQVQIRGHRIEPGEIESVLARHPAVSKIFVSPYEDRAGIKNLVAYYVSGKEQHPDPSFLRNEAQKILPGYMVPSLFMAIDEMPLTDNGKVDRSALPEPQNRRSPDRPAKIIAETELEASIKEIWSEFLERKDISTEENFFELGGHSLMLMKVCNHLNKMLHENIRVVDLFAYPTIKGLAEFIRKGESVDELHDEEQQMKQRLEQRKLKYKQNF